MHLSARFHWKWPPVLWYDLPLRKLIKEVYYDLKYNHFFNRDFSYFSPLLLCVDDLSEKNNNASCNNQALFFSSSGSFLCYLRLHFTLWNLSHAHWSICPSRGIACKHSGNSTRFALKDNYCLFAGVYPGRENVGFCKA